MKNVKLFSVDVVQFRHDFEANGPMVPGLPPHEANERLRRFLRLYEAPYISLHLHVSPCISQVPEAVRGTRA